MNNTIYKRRSNHFNDASFNILKVEVDEIFNGFNQDIILQPNIVIVMVDKVAKSLVYYHNLYVCRCMSYYNDSYM